jgi:hypothetical protein
MPQLAQQEVLVDPQLGRRLLQQRVHAATVQRDPQLAARYWLIGAGTDPRLHRAAQSMLPQHADQALQAASLFDQLTHDVEQRVAASLVFTQ